ncbi:MAG: hypothetical protein ACYSTI_14250, partial [Planctomycetota bacterium]
MLLESGRAKTVAILESSLRGRTEAFLVLDSIPQWEMGAQASIPMKTNYNHYLKLQLETECKAVSKVLCIVVNSVA